VLMIIGATGMFGSRAVDELLDRGTPLRALVRDPARAPASALADRGVDLVTGDMDDPAGLPAALDGVDRLFLLAPMDADKGRRERAVIDAAATVGGIHVVLLTGGVQHDDALGRDSATAARALQDSGLAWTLLGPQSVMESNLLSQAEAVRSTDGIWGCAGDGRIAMVALDDVGRAIAEVCTGDGHDGREYIITGPRAVTYAEIAAALSAELDRTITYNDLPDAEFRQLMIDVGAFTEDDVDIGVVCHMQAFKAGQATLVTDDYRRLTGQPPTAIEAWVHDHRDAFA
jgi:uncharacterized protein YbjT (DUF2867 family)